MKTIKKLTLLILLSSLIFGCSKDGIIETKKNSSPSAPTSKESQQAKEKLQPVEGWNSSKKPDFNSLKSARAAIGEYLQISGYYSDGGTYFISGNLNITGCVPSDQQAYVIYWVYDFAIGQWKIASQKSGQCMAEDNLDNFVTYYSNNAQTDFYMLAAAQVYIEDASGQVSLWNTFYSNIIFLDGPF